MKANSKTSIDIIGMNSDTPIPQEIEKHWASQQNKQNLQLLVRHIAAIEPIAMLPP